MPPNQPRRKLSKRRKIIAGATLGGLIAASAPTAISEYKETSSTRQIQTQRQRLQEQSEEVDQQHTLIVNEHTDALKRVKTEIGPQPQRANFGSEKDFQLAVQQYNARHQKLRETYRTKELNDERNSLQAKQRQLHSQDAKLLQKKTSTNWWTKWLFQLGLLTAIVRRPVIDLKKNKENRP